MHENARRWLADEALYRPALAGPCVSTPAWGWGERTTGLRMYRHIYVTCPIEHGARARASWKGVRAGNQGGGEKKRTLALRLVSSEILQCRVAAAAAAPPVSAASRSDQ
ncbi:hypothetical protein ARSEF4850_000865 [Beauveria asiatica]